jgi:hypothetical protein
VCGNAEVVEVWWWHKPQTQMEGSDLDHQIERLKRGEIITESEVEALCGKAKYVPISFLLWESRALMERAAHAGGCREILMQESNVQPVDSPVTVRLVGRSRLYFDHSWWLMPCYAGVRRHPRPVLRSERVVQGESAHSNISASSLAQQLARAHRAPPISYKCAYFVLLSFSLSL